METSEEDKKAAIMSNIQGTSVLGVDYYILALDCYVKAVEGWPENEKFRFDIVKFLITITENNVSISDKILKHACRVVIENDILHNENSGLDDAFDSNPILLNIYCEYANKYPTNEMVLSIFSDIYTMIYYIDRRGKLSDKYVKILNAINDDIPKNAIAYGHFGKSLVYAYLYCSENETATLANEFLKNAFIFDENRNDLLFYSGLLCNCLKDYQQSKSLLLKYYSNTKDIDAVIPIANASYLSGNIDYAIKAYYAARHQLHNNVSRNNYNKDDSLVKLLNKERSNAIIIYNYLKLTGLHSINF